MCILIRQMSSSNHGGFPAIEGRRQVTPTPDRPGDLSLRGPKERVREGQRITSPRQIGKVTRDSNLIRDSSMH